MSIEVKVRIEGTGKFRGDTMLKRMKDEIELLSRHIEVARTVAEHQPIGIMKLAEILDLPSHRIRYSPSRARAAGLHPRIIGRSDRNRADPGTLRTLKRGSGRYYPARERDEKTLTGNSSCGLSVALFTLSWVSARPVSSFPP